MTARSPRGDALDWLLPWLLKLPASARYGAAVTVTGAAFGLRYSLDATDVPVVPFAPFYPAILLAALIGGLGPGLIALALSSTLSARFWLVTNEAGANAGTVINLGLFIGTAAIVLFAAEVLRQNLKRLADSEARFRASQELSPYAFTILRAVRDQRGTVTDFEWEYLNGIALEVMNARGEQLVGKRLCERLPANRTNPFLFPRYVDVLTSGRADEVELPYAADGVSGWFLNATTRIDEDRIAVSFRDITAMRESALALQSSEQRLRLAQEAAGIGTWESSLVDRRVIWSPEMFRLYGRDPALGEPTIDEWFKMIHPEDVANAVLPTDPDALTDADPAAFTFRAVRPDGAVIWFESRATLLRDEKGRPERYIGVNIDVTSEKRASERERLLAREVDHRARNLLAVVQSVIDLTREQDPVALRSTLKGRIAALSRTHSLLAASRWDGASLRRIIEDELAPFDDGERIEVDGDDVQLKPEAAQAVSLVLHELATNAAKHGCLSAASGVLKVSWRFDGAPHQGLILAWRETGGPTVEAPSRRGFGSTVIRASIERQLGGRLDLDWRSAGLACTIIVPAEHFASVGVPDGQPTAASNVTVSA